MAETESNGAAIELREVTKLLGDFGGVRQVSLTIREGEFFTLLGPSGCGKTTSLRMIADFEIPTRGEVYIQNQTMGLTPPFQRIANMLFQNYALFLHLTVYQNVAFGLEMKRLPKNGVQQQVNQALEMVQLGGYQQRSPK